MTRLVVAVLLVVAAASACSSGSAGDAGSGDPASGAAGTVPPATAPPQDQVVYVSLGGAETLRGDVDEPILRNLWSQQVFARGLPTSARYVNLATPVATVRSALDGQLPAAISLDATIATVWFGWSDSELGTDPDDYADALTELVDGLRAGGVDQVIVLSATAGPGSGYAEVTAEVGSATGVTVVEIDGDPFAAGSAEAQSAIADLVIAALG